MPKTRPKLPVGLFISVAVLLILGAIAGPVIRSTATEEQLNTNVLLGAIPFILIFVAIILAFISVISMVASVLNENVDTRTYQVVEYIIIGGIVFGIVGMFQPWLFLWYRFGFIVLLLSTLSFILWSHVIPRSIQRQDEVSSRSTEKFE